MLNREIRELECVPRWGIVRVLKRQTVAEHSYFTAMYANEIAIKIGLAGEYPCYMGQLLSYALWHDVEESFMSDIPGPIKRGFINETTYDNYAEKECKKRWGKSKESFLVGLPSSVRLAWLNIVKCASLMDDVFYLMGEQQMGNATITAVLQINYDRLVGLFDKLPFANIEFEELAQKHFSTMMENNHNEYSKIISTVEFEG